MRGRRTALAGALALLLATAAVVGGVVGAASQAPTVSVFASWTGDEGAVFGAVLDDFTERTGIEVEYQGTTAQREVLMSQVRSGSPPDVAILSSPGELAEYAARDEILPLGAALGEQRDAYREPWLTPLSGAEAADVYWVPVKVDLKSVVWYDPARLSPDEAVSLAGDGDNWCLGMGSDATSGWPGTDWVEDLLLQSAGPDAYESWATGTPGSWTTEEMAAAWRGVAQVLTGQGSTRATESLTQDIGVASGGLFAAEPRCALDHQSSFIRGLYGAEAPGDGVPEAAFLASSTVLPGTGGRQRGWEVAGDFAGMFRDTQEARRLIGYLASAEAQEVWARAVPDDVPSPMFANSRVPRDVYADDPAGGAVADLLRGPGPHCLDASDAMPPAMRDAFQQAVLRLLAAPDEPPDGLLAELEVARAAVTEDGGVWLSSVCG
ncbi:extracellular solute-binding protein [Streptomyces hainanensis]|uniref:Extracellular solute-binding protein n=1 Tax=Streptomyces hainanensis TaxID=402648 RepID=A0A4R4TLK4_9ACTN|nr:extracellular solute-binding protein [Streptomyces hainanensis]TDC74949.1 extracellular solute-binding protein [Streptomyces hainanensis]